MVVKIWHTTCSYSAPYIARLRVIHQIDIYGQKENEEVKHELLTTVH